MKAGYIFQLNSQRMAQEADIQCSSWRIPPSIFPRVTKYYYSCLVWLVVAVMVQAYANWGREILPFWPPLLDANKFVSHQ